MNFLKPTEIDPMDGDEFREVCQWACEVAHGNVPDGIRSVSTTAKIQSGGKTYQLKDCPDNRFGIAIAQRYKGDLAKSSNVMFRWFGFLHITDQLPSEYRRRSLDPKDPDMIHPAVFAVAARQPLDKDCNFELSAFLVELRKECQKPQYEDL